MSYDFLETANYDWMDMLNFYERPFRAKFVPAKVWKDLDNYRNDSKGLSNYFKKWRTKVEFLQEKSKAKWTETRVASGGEYDPTKRQCTIQIYTSKYDTFKFSDENWNKFKARLMQIAMHELIHFMQFDRRGDEWSNYVVPYKKVKHEKKNIERKYLSEFDEIQAYAHCAFVEFKIKKPSLSIDQLINRAKTHNDSQTLGYYLKTFDHDYRNNHAIPKLLHHIAKWDRKYQRTIRASRKS